MMTSIRGLTLAMLLVLTGIAVAACTPLVRQHGYIPPPEDLAQVVVGQTHRDELETLLGRPSSQGVLDGSGWYYVGSRWETLGMLQPREVDRQVLAISFDGAGTVSNVERFGLEDGRVVVLSRRVTDAGVSSVSLIRQILGNLGNFNPGTIFD